MSAQTSIRHGAGELHTAMQATITRNNPLDLVVPKFRVSKEAVTMCEESRTLIERFWKAIHSNDFPSVGGLLHDDFLLEWPQSGERIRGAKNFISMNERYPAAGPWRFTINRVVAGASGGVSDVTVTDGERVDRAVTFFELRDGRIWRMIEYWPEPFAPAEWRRSLVESGA